MRDDERIEGLGVAARRQVAGDGAAERAVERQEEQAADAEEHAAGKTLERDADVVHHVKAEHAPVGVGVARPADVAAARVVHVVVLLHRVRIVQGEHEAGVEVGDDAQHDERQREHECRHPDVAAVRAHRLRHVDEEQLREPAGAAHLADRVVDALRGAFLRVVLRQQHRPLRRLLHRQARRGI